MNIEASKKIAKIIKKRLRSKGLTENIIKEIISSNPKPIDSRYEDITIKHFNFKKM